MLLVAASAVSLVATFSGANACVFLPVPFIGTEKEKRISDERAKRERREATRARQVEFRTIVRSGEIDSADGLAKLLIPNVREWYEDRSNCGPGGDFDGPPMSTEGMIVDAFAGSELEGLDASALGDAFPAFIRRSLQTYNHDCNAEFRDRFADRLRIDVKRREQDSAFLRLSDDGERRSGYYRFPDPERRTVPRIEASSPAITGLLTSGRHPVSRALASFWTDAGPRLGSAALSCPMAHRQFVVERDDELRRLCGTPRYSRLLQRATGSRERRKE